MNYLLMKGRARLLLAGAFLALPVGCAPVGEGLVEVSGTVSLKGQLLDQGVIQFQLEDPSEAFSRRALIANGKYAIAKDKGLKPGSYKIMISSGDVKHKEEEVPGISTQLAKERIPPEFNVNSTKVVEVKENQPNQFDFSIP